MKYAKKYFLKDLFGFSWITMDFRIFYLTPIACKILFRLKFKIK